MNGVVERGVHMYKGKATKNEVGEWQAKLMQGG